MAGEQQQAAALTGDDYTRIYKEAVLGAEPSDTSPEALAYRKQVDAEIQQARTSGYQFHIPSEMPGVD